MGTPGPTGNGCSLEDCYTNLFAVTDLCGIRWRRLEPESVPFDQLDDPILVSWSKCVQNGFLSVWRKVINRPQDHTISYSKELWVFYYGKEPEEVLDTILSSDLKEVERGSWDKDREKDTGLNYECRTLVFKALHNLIERSFLSKNFMRLGRWFVKPYDHGSANDKNPHLSIALNFLLHGESQVCASLETRLHPPVWRLTVQHLTLVQENHATFQVILGPYGLSGTLTGNAYRDGDHASRRLMEEWKNFYPIPEPEGKENDPTRPPNVVEVIVAGCRMYYPSHYVLICENDDATGRIQPVPGTAPANVTRQACLTAPLLSNALMTPPTSPGDPSTAVEPGVKVVPVPSVNTGLSESSQIPAPVSGEVLGFHLTRKVIQDACTSIGMSRSRPEPEEPAAAGTWCLADPCTKVSCLCRHRRSKSAASGAKGMAGSKHSKGEKPEKADRQQTRHRPAVPFHRRATTVDDLLQFDLDTPMPHPAFCPTGGTTVAPPSTPGAREETPMDIAPAAPLPLDEPQPPANSNHDPPMPTLSPHPPAKLNGDGDFAAKPGANSDSQPSVMCNGFPEYYKGGEDSASKPVTTNSPGFGPSILEPYKNESVNMWLEAQRTQPENHGLKMPQLPTKETDCEDSPEMSSLYNFSAEEDWMNMIVKKPRLEATCDNLGSPQQAGGEGSHSQRAEAPAPTSPVSDPFEFSDENSNSLNPNSGLLSRGKRKSRDEIFPRPSPVGRMDSDSRDTMRHGSEVIPRDDAVNDLGSPATPGSMLTREKDLVPKAGDLDHIFDSSEDDSDDAGCSDVGTTNNKACKPNPQTEELTRMYPTPPSDTNKAASPETLTETGATDTAIHEASSGEVDNYMYTPSVGDSSFKEEVFRPPSKVPFATAPKYDKVILSQRDRLGLSGTGGSSIICLSYKPPLHFNMPLMEKPQPQSNPYISPMENIPSLSRLPLPMESSPAFINCLRTPMSQELQSPASNASSYLNRTLNSIENPRTNQQLPEIHSLVVNVILSDSILNLFKDHNFDSCNICACNSDIKGSDIGPYLPDPGTSSESSFTCRCGFSAVMNRHFGYNAGLFYEDEVEITGIRDDRYDHRKPSLIATHQLKEGEKDAKDAALPEDVPQFVLELLLGQFNTSYPSFVTNYMFEQLQTAASTTLTNGSINFLLMRDGNEAVYAALEQGRQAMDNCSPNKLDDSNFRNLCLHRWPYLRDANRLPHTSQDVLQVLKAMQPLLQEAVHRQRGGRIGDKLVGPLTWKDFHQLAGRGSDENCEPQPIPYLLVGYDRDWLSVSPFSVRFWDKQFMEPFARQRDIAYVVVAPDNDYVLSHVRTYFTELSTIYEQGRLGKHRPGLTMLKDGIVRVGKKSTQNLSDCRVDEWFSQIGDTPMAAKLKLIAQVCEHHLGPLLTKHLKSLDKSIFETGPTSSKPVFKTPEPAAPSHPPTPESQNSASTTSNSEEKGKEENGSQPEAAPTHKESAPHEAENDDPSTCPAVVIYLVNPFTYGREWDDLDRLAMVGLLRAYQQMIKTLPEHLQNNMYLQMVPMSTVMNHGPSVAHFQTLKSMAFSVFTACRWNLTHSICGRSLTGFGPAAVAEQLLRKKEPEKGGWVKMYAPPFVLAPLKDKQRQLAESCGEKTEKGIVVFCTYCLSEDQRWLLGAITDERGEMMETININIEIPNRNRRKKASARRVGLQRLWDFLVEVISSTTLQVRLVVGRFGRIGHSELKGWAGLLSKKNLQSLNKRMEKCNQCNMMASSDRACLLSASLVSLEPQPSMQVLWECVKVEEKVASNCPLQTPRDASCTHILVFPTSATAQAHSQPLNAEAQMGLNDTHLEFGDVFDLRDEEYLTHMEDGNIFDIVGNLDNFDELPPSPPPGMDLGGDDRGKSSSKANCPSNPSSSSGVHDPQSGEVNLLQQPLAMGYYISTAKSGPLPKWFWSACPENEHIIPHAFKSALHIHSMTSHEEFYSTQTRNSHPLDSYITCDVLRFVLENYNSLSWLTYDPAKNDRRSCLPIHMVVLMQMYHALNAFV